MSTNELNNVPKPAPAPQEKRRKVVVVPTVPHEGRVNLIVALMAAVVSIGAHVLMILLMLTVGMGSAAALPTGEVKSETVVEEKKDEKDNDLTQEDIGLDPSVPTNFNVERFDDVSVPGIVNPTEAVGVVGAPEGPARTLPAPPGTGGGQGGAVFDPNQAGTGSMFGQIGGMSGGVANMGGYAGRSGATRDGAGSPPMAVGGVHHGGAGGGRRLPYQPQLLRRATRHRPIGPAVHHRSRRQEAPGDPPGAAHRRRDRPGQRVVLPLLQAAE